MSRIRSVHPGFFTDENLVCASMAARLLFIGLGVEADDKGIFEWKPLTLKMRLFPADHVLVEELLAELVNVNAVRQYEIDGRKYGAIRNFRRHQKPKTPNSVHPITPEIGIYVALPTAVSETEDDEQGQFPPKGEKPRLMEDGGEEEGGKNNKGGLAFAGKVVRLRRDDFDRWETAYPALDLHALLTARDDWLINQPEPERKRWFNSTSNFLAKKQQEAKTRSSPVSIVC